MDDGFSRTGYALLHVLFHSEGETSAPRTLQLLKELIEMYKQHGHN